MKIRILTSSSSGNCILLWDNTSSCIVDCGCSVSYAKRHLLDNNISFSSLNGACITHVHRDHINPIFFRALLKQNVPVFCSTTAHPYLPTHSPATNLSVVTYAPFVPFFVGTMKITPFPVTHDSPGGCCGFSIEVNAKRKMRKITIATDIGKIEPATADYFTNSDIVIIESNHDIAMLASDSIPQFLKTRIRTSHLSNDECAEILEKALQKSTIKPEAIILAHISTDRNSKTLARQCIGDRLRRIGHESIPLIVSHDHCAGEIVELH
ncbi:MAG: hypothetical protein GF350_17500 [Chitinivibrionales bacterium]|nr:hypothetical protein [Chitinivibrionales bacterium]